MKCKLLYFILFFWVYSSAQQKLIDSLSEQLKLYPDNSIEKLTLLNDLCYYYNNIQPKEGLLFCDKAINLAKKLESKEQLALAYKFKGVNYYALANTAAALKMYDSAIEIQKTFNDEKALAKTIYNKGLVYFNASDYKESNHNYREAYIIFEKEKDSFLMAKMLNSIAINQMYQVKYPEAIKTFNEAAIIYENLNKQNDFEYGSIQANLGLLYKRLDKFDQAIAQQEKALLIYQRQGNLYGQANALSNLGNCYDSKGNSLKAIEYYKESNKLNERIGNTLLEANNHTNTGIAYISLKRFDDAIENLEQAISNYKKIGNTTNLAIANENLGTCYREKYKVNPQSSFVKKATTYFNNALVEAKSVNNILVQQQALEGLSWTSSKLNDFKKAFQQKERATVLKDSFLSLEKMEAFAKMEAQFTFEKKEALLKAAYSKEQALAKAQMQRQKIIKNGTIVGGLSLSFLSIIGFVLYKKRQEAVFKTKEAQFSTEVAQTELKALRAQINPHFIFNSLNSIGDYIIKNDIHSASDYLSKFAKLIREILQNSEKKNVLLSEDISVLKMYLDIENKRFDRKFLYTFDISDTIDANNVLVPPLIIQPFIENSIKHGLAKNESDGHIKITIDKKGDALHYIVDDNGVGRNVTAVKSNNRTSLGIKITENRINILNRTNNIKGSVKIMDKEKGVRVEVYLPLLYAS
ncbi:sensor histidine kinase [Patiriisocius marinistellae]|uniref:Sensor histidine kinase n=1 Tax=Patiriisocius marinistellae TaxID=2494560 RepID=A0A5J4FYL4_9FLAO|nr:tetratricopeptide repeat protein [Patiriisocius marinistellae]GEQ85206.1 sensor histidine kinase [Patiriisocius marinistellae]